MSRLGGYVDCILNVDLSRGELTEQVPEEALLRAFIGGYGLGARLLYERIKPGKDPLGPSNVLGLVTGPLTGTPALMGSRYCAVAKSPLTGGWGDANSGGDFGPALKYAGYDAVFLSGVSEDPVYLFLDNGRAELRPADDLWGLDAVETEKALQARHGSDVRVACIGPAGERLARIACIMNDRGRAAGRSGLGAVMGSKRLKAVAALGNQKPPVAFPDCVKALRKRHFPSFKTAPYAQVKRRYGTAGYLKAMTTIGRTPVKNWRGTYPDDFPNPDSLDGPAVVAFEEKKYTCWHCPVACGGIMEWETDGQLHADHKLEYESLASLGTYVGIEDLEAVMNLQEICNRSGLDTISAGACIAFASECYEHGLFTTEELDGLTLEWGNAEAAITLLKRIVERRGLGDLLAEGVMRASQTLGRGSAAFAMHAGGQELPAHDPRHEADFGLVYQMSPTPGRHTQGGVGAKDMTPEEREAYGLDPDLADEDPLTYHAQAYATVSAWKNVVNSAGLCLSGSPIMTPEWVPAFIAAVTGWDFDMAECLKAGERIEAMRLLFGLREGHNPLQVQVPPRVLGQPPLKTGPTAGVTVELHDLRDMYVELMDWDPVTALPSQSRLATLGLDRLVAG